jgi:hypothetical protein
MGFADQYLSKQKGVIPNLSGLPSESLRFIVVIPAYCEPHLTDTLESLWNCQRPNGHIEVIIIVNSSENADPEVMNSNLATIGIVSQWIDRHHDPTLRFLVIEKLNMSAKDAGVGLARKTGMDEALNRFNQANNPNGFILSFDADSRCDLNYFTAIEEAISRQPVVKGFDIYFEHPVSGNYFPEKVYRGIIYYELHLRYVNRFLRFAGFPFAHHTVGSCFGVRADVYAGQGGMNKRKAGEDFYFLHKIIPLGHFIDINTTRVIPSPRESNRVPFGTGTAITRYLSSTAKEILTYAPDGFLSLRQFFEQTPKLFKIKSGDLEAVIEQLPVSLKSFLLENNVMEALAEINANCGSLDSFINRFFRWFDAFRIIKYLNYASRSYFKQIPVREAVMRFLHIAGYINMPETASAYELLMLLREIERGFRL